MVSLNDMIELIRKEVTTSSCSSHSPLGARPRLGFHMKPHDCLVLKKCNLEHKEIYSAHYPLAKPDQWINDSNLVKGARTYCIIDEGTSRLPKNAIGSCTNIDKNSKKNFSVRLRTGLRLYQTVILHVFQKVAEDF